MIESGGIGRVIWVRSRESHSGPHSAHFWDISKTGGGAMQDMGCHCVEAARYLFGKDDPILEVMAWGDTLVHYNDRTRGEDNALLVLRFASRGIAHCELSWSTLGGLDLYSPWNGWFYLHRCHPTDADCIVHQENRGVVEKADLDYGWTRPPEEAFAYGYQAEMEHFVECVREGKTPREIYEDGYVANRILDAGYESMRSRTWVKVGE